MFYSIEQAENICEAPADGVTTIKNCGLACEIRFYREKDADINYTIYTDYVYTTTGFYNFLYKVYNDEYIVDEGYEVRETSITRVTSDVLELKLSLGEDPIITRYYSIKNNLVLKSLSFERHKLKKFKNGHSLSNFSPLLYPKVGFGGSFTSK